MFAASLYPFLCGGKGGSVFGVVFCGPTMVIKGISSPMPDHGKTNKGRIHPSSADTPHIALQSQLTRARCEVETLRGFKTENVAKELTIRDLNRKLKSLETKLKTTEAELSEALMHSEETSSKLTEASVSSAMEVERLTLLLQKRPVTPSGKGQDNHADAPFKRNSKQQNEVISSRLSSAQEELSCPDDNNSLSSPSSMEAMKHELELAKMAEMAALSELAHLKLNETEKRKEIALEANEMAKIKQELAVSCRANADFEAEVEKLNEELAIYRNLPPASDQSFTSKSPSEFSEMVDHVPPLEPRTESPNRSTRSRPGSRESPSSTSNNNEKIASEQDRESKSAPTGSGGTGMGALWGRMRTPRSAVSTPRSAVNENSRETSQALEEKELEINKLRKVVAVGQKEVSKLQSQVTKLKSENKKLKSSSSHNMGHHNVKPKPSGSIDETQSSDANIVDGSNVENENSPQGSNDSSLNAEKMVSSSSASSIVDMGTNSSEQGTPNDQNDSQQQNKENGVDSDNKVVEGDDVAMDEKSDNKEQENGLGGSNEIEFCDDTGREEEDSDESSKMDEEDKKEAELMAKYNLDQEEFSRIQYEFNEHMVKGLNKKDFMEAVTKLLSHDSGSGGKPAPPAKKKDLMKAFDVADADGSGVVDLGEFVNLYNMVKLGEVKGLGGGGMFSFFKKRR